MNSTDTTEYYELSERTHDTPKNAAFSVTLADNSMEPFFPAGSDIYISVSHTPAEFEAALFLFEGKILCRQWCEDFAGTLYLLPANPACQDLCVAIPARLRGKCLCLGSVISRRALPKPVYFRSGGISADTEAETPLLPR